MLPHKINNLGNLYTTNRRLNFIENEQFNGQQSVSYDFPNFVSRAVHNRIFIPSKCFYVEDWACVRTSIH